MDTILYLDCQTGISGDMAVAALLDLGADRAALDAALASLRLDGFKIEIGRAKKSGLDCCDFHVALDATHANHDHDMAWLYGHGKEVPHAHPHHHDGAHAHPLGEDHHAHHSAHSHEHRGMPEIREILGRATLTDRAREMALRTFEILARAEAKAHGTAVDDVHFHEVGAVDSIVDIVAAATCLDNLGVRRVAVPVLCEGHGTVRCQHGILPVPVPAVANVAAEAGLPLRITDLEGERVTPTGAAFAAAIRTEAALPPAFRITKVGLGAGKRAYERPSVLRAMLVEEVDSSLGRTAPETVAKMECELDDATGEELGFAMERMLAAGALEVDYAPVFMKKNRPGWRLTLLCRPGEEERFAELVLSETPTLGVRWTRMTRRTLARGSVSTMTPWGELSVKTAEAPDGAGTKLHAEYEEAARTARKANVPLRAVTRAAERGVIDFPRLYAR